jgi:hypothetical protein
MVVYVYSVHVVVGELVASVGGDVVVPVVVAVVVAEVGDVVADVAIVADVAEVADVPEVADVSDGAEVLLVGLVRVDLEAESTTLAPETGLLLLALLPPLSPEPPWGTALACVPVIAAAATSAPPAAKSLVRLNSAWLLILSSFAHLQFPQRTACGVPIACSP